MKVQIATYKPIKKNTMEGIFSFIVDDLKMKFINCKHFKKGDSHWFSFPNFDIKGKPGEETRYIPYVCFTDADTKTKFHDDVMNALLNYLENFQNGILPAARKNAQSYAETQGKKDMDKGDPQELWF